MRDNELFIPIDGVLRYIELDKMDDYGDIQACIEKAKKSHFALDSGSEDAIIFVAAAAFRAR